MLVVKRLVVWLIERTVEACLLGLLLGVLLSLRPLSAFFVWGLVAASVLFAHGYYVVTAVFGVVWRTANIAIHASMTSVVFAFCVVVVFFRFGHELTPEARNIELPFAVGGAILVGGCAAAGSAVLRRWTYPPSKLNPYLGALGITSLIFLLANTANWLRPVVGDTAFRTYGLPFTIYREGGFIRQWVWRSGTLMWSGMIADVGVIALTVLLLGKLWQILVRDH